MDKQGGSFTPDGKFIGGGKPVYVSTEDLNRIREELGLPLGSPVYRRRYHVVDRKEANNE